MTLCVLQIIERMDGLRMDGLSGMYVQEYDPRVDFDLNYTLIVVDNPVEAKVFTDPGEASEYYRQVCPNIPTLANGNPNRPLTSWHVQCVPLDIKNGNAKH